jgi:hypothetical protein
MGIPSDFLAAIFLALLGFILAYLNNIRIDKRKEKLELINKQINQFYGPLFVSVNTSDIAYKAYLKKIENRKSVDSGISFNEYENKEWEIWLESVFMPLNLFGEKVILENAYLIREAEMPECLIKFLTHVSAYKALLKKWENGDKNEVMPLIDFPKELSDYVRESYLELKTEQLRLIGQSKVKKEKNPKNNRA